MAELNPSASALVFATYLGGPPQEGTSCEDQPLAIAIDSSGASFVTGIEASPKFPTTPGAFQTVKKNYYSDAFVSKLNGTGSALSYSTLLGGSGGPVVFGSCTADFGNAIAVDAADNAYVTGQVTSQDFPITNTTVEPVCNPGQEGGCGSFVAEVDPTGTGLVFSTYLGANIGTFGVGADATGIALDPTNDIYVTGSGSLPLIDAPPLLQAGPGFITKIDLTTAAPAAALLPTSPNFGIVATGSSSQLPLTLTDRGDADLAITDINISGTFFTQTNNCPASLSPAASCTITVTFSPTSTGIGGGQVTVTDGAFDSPHFSFLIGTGGTASGSLSTGSLSFGDQGLNSTSPPQPVKLSSTGTAALSITSIATSGDFAQTNNCGSSVVAGSSCTINVTFTPTALGSLSGVLTIVAGSSGSLPPVLLGGTGVPSLNLGVAPGSSNSAAVRAGSTANYILSIGGGGIGGMATLTCTGAPTGAMCSLPGSENVSATTPAIFKVSVTTAAPSGTMLVPVQRSFAWVWATALIGLWVLPMRQGNRSSRIKRCSWIAIFLILLVAGCGGGPGGGASDAGGGSGSGGTPIGTYTLTVAATESGTTQTLPLTLKVQ